MKVPAGRASGESRFVDGGLLAVSPRSWRDETVLGNRF